MFACAVCMCIKMCMFICLKSLYVYVCVHVCMSLWFFFMSSCACSVAQIHTCVAIRMSCMLDSVFVVLIFCCYPGLAGVGIGLEVRREAISNLSNRKGISVLTL